MEIFLTTTKNPIVSVYISMAERQNANADSRCNISLRNRINTPFC